jgi:hypothetical protein
MREALAFAMAEEEPTQADRDGAEVLEQVWFAAVVAWASNIQPASYIDAAIGRALALIECSAHAETTP